MYAIIQSGGKQYRVSEGDLVRLERLDGEVGDSVSLDGVLFIGSEGSSQAGTPLVEGAKVLGTIQEQGRGDKVVVFKFKRRKMYRRKQGHRQAFTAVQIDSISTPTTSRKKTKTAKVKEASAEAADAANQKEASSKAASKAKAADKSVTSSAAQKEAESAAEDSTEQDIS